MRQPRKPREPRQPRQPRSTAVPSSLYRVASVAPTGDPRCPAMVSVEVAGVGVIHCFCLEDKEESGWPTLGSLARLIERPGGGELEIKMVEFSCPQIKRQLELEALSAFAALKGSEAEPQVFPSAAILEAYPPTRLTTRRSGQPRSPETEA